MRKSSGSLRQWFGGLVALGQHCRHGGPLRRRLRGLSDLQLEILGFLRSHFRARLDPPTVMEVSREFDLPPDDVLHLLRPIEEAGVIERLNEPGQPILLVQ
jgi:DNA-binding transcriptional ArsR family regulator